MNPSRGVDRELAARFAAIVGERHCLSGLPQRAAYESDGLMSLRQLPGLVVLPASTDEVVEVVRLAREAGMAVVGRGAGSGLSGGALPVPGCVVVGMARMKRILEIDLGNALVRVEPGVTNLEISKRLAGAGYYYAPDPSSQSVCTIGGNVSENSGGAHCLKYGFTAHHVLGVRMVLFDGSVVDVGGPALDAPGYDLLGLIVGSEGMLGIVTEVTLKVLRKPEATRTFFATFPSTDEAGAAVSAIIASGVVPAAIEMMDRLAIVAAKAATGLDWPDVGAALLMDVDGPVAEAEHTSRNAIDLATRAGALEVRVPRDEAERQLMWKGRKSAFAAVGRISPNYVVQDGVIPRSEIARVLREIDRLTREAGLRVANVFHAGDGNLHPLVLYDAKVPGEERKAEELSGEILKMCVRFGGSITGEHGVGAEKSAYMNDMFAPSDLETMDLVRSAFDPERLFNPGKVLPKPRMCGEAAGRPSAAPAEASR
jgi:glycolate oxidase